jgi:hypothetical protein
MLYNICPETLCFLDTRHRQMGLHTSQQCYLSRRYTKRVVKCTQDTQVTAGLSCDRVIMEYTHDEYCDMLLTLGACNSRAGTAAREYAIRYPGRRHPDANVFRRLEQRLSETGIVTPTALVNAGRSRNVRTPANEDAIIAAVERQPLRSSRDISRKLGVS